MARHEDGSRVLDPAILKVAREAGEGVRSRRSDVRPVEDDLEWGMWNGKLSALRWVLGDEWDFLDT